MGCVCVFFALVFRNIGYLLTDVNHSTELFVIIICGSIPTLKILYDRYFTTKTPSQIFFSLRNLVSRYSTRISRSPSASRDTHTSSKHPYQKQQDVAAYQLDERTPGENFTIVEHHGSEESWPDGELGRDSVKNGSGIEGGIKVNHTFEVV